MSPKEHDEKLNAEKADNNTKKKITSKQIAAIIGIVLLVLLYLITLITAFVDQSASKNLFQACLFGTVAIPVLIWIYIWMYGKLTQKHTIADPSTADSATADSFAVGSSTGTKPSDSAK